MSANPVLTRVRTALGHHGRDDRDRLAAIEERLDAPPRHLIPERASRPKDKLKAQFISCLEDQSVTIVEVRSAEDIPVAVAGYLARERLPPCLRFGADPRLTALPWERVPGLRRLAGPADPADQAGLSHAVAGVAETGTLVLVSGPANPTSLAFLPETHVVAVAEDTIVGSYEEALDIVRGLAGRRTLPRALNLVSGPSRTGDIGGRIVLGAHGPRRLAVAVYGSR